MKLKAPNNFNVVGEDGACFARWDAVEGADGYKLYFFRASEMESCIKIRYSQTCEKTVLGFENNEEYLVRLLRLKTERKMSEQRARKLHLLR